jgi:hypothetical protein
MADIPSLNNENEIPVEYQRLFWSRNSTPNFESSEEEQKFQYSVVIQDRGKAFELASRIVQILGHDESVYKNSHRTFDCRAIPDGTNKYKVVMKATEAQFSSLFPQAIIQQPSMALRN